MSWSITELARMSGVTARTLRHYDDIGVLTPARVGDNGYRWYEREQLLRLQEILLMRQVDLDLPTIARVLDGEHDRLAALRDHRERLLAQRDRLDRLVRTVARTIADLEGADTMPDDELFDGFQLSPAVLDELEARSPESSKPYFDELRAGTANWTEQDYAAANEQTADSERRLLALMLAEAPADDPRVLDLMAEAHAAEREVLVLSKEDYCNLARAFVAMPELRAHLDARHPRLAEYMRDAMLAYAAARMK
ncbi:MerR family transcriptional regulator [Kutzneria buriramensis]|uniref:DNA-binding transcriptional MerR regulator n=1 Tax=Kutzneria buriramensis TaxID=1045776 RepID=A0A3E0ICL6_9PSEU|nr:MerR family transcriptional regulator [Kutzneria buriramensis]REH55925.1 DNA-binding transcriptional MerR regulator [Kutzneria buriramensis]